MIGATRGQRNNNRWTIYFRRNSRGKIQKTSTWLGQWYTGSRRKKKNESLTKRIYYLSTRRKLRSESDSTRYKRLWIRASRMKDIETVRIWVRIWDFYRTWRYRSRRVLDQERRIEKRPLSENAQTRLQIRSSVNKLASRILQTKSTHQRSTRSWSCQSWKRKTH